MKEHHKWIRVLALLLCVALVLLALQVAVRWIEKAIYPRRYAEFVQKYAQQYSLEENFVYAIIRTESGFNPNARSNVDARGLMQITQETFDWIKSKIAPNEAIEFNDLFDPEVNIRFGAYFLSVCLTQYNGDMKTAAAAYHSGMGTVDALLKQEQYSFDGEVLHSFPYAQMSNYVAKISFSYEKYRMLYQA